MRLENIYLRRESVESFIKTIKYDPLALTNIAQCSSDYFLSQGKRSIKILDIGIGTGAFTIPIVEHFEREQKLDYSLMCFDISGHMIQRFDDTLSRANVSQSKIRFFSHDAEDGLVNTFDLKSFDLIITTFTLHYIDNWEGLLDDVADCLKEDGLLVQAEVAGDLRSVDGNFDNDSPTLFQEFWKRYFAERTKYSEWSPEICISNLTSAYDYLRQKNDFKLYKEQSYLWEQSIRWSELCEWIVQAPLPSLGSGIGFVTRRYLAKVMEGWLQSNGISERRGIPLEWGLKVTWMCPR